MPLPGRALHLLLASGQTGVCWQQLGADCTEWTSICMWVLPPPGLGCTGLMNARSVAAGTASDGGVWPPACGTGSRAFDLSSTDCPLAVKFVTKLWKDGLSQR